MGEGRAEPRTAYAVLYAPSGHAALAECHESAAGRD